VIEDIEEILKLHAEGTFSRREVMVQVFDLIDDHGIDEVLAGLPEAWRDSFVRWARAKYDNETPATEFVYLHAPEIPPEKVRTIEAIRAYFRRPDAPAPFTVLGDESSLRRVGCFKETGFEHDSETPSLVGLVGLRRKAHTGDVWRYLRGGKVHVPSSESVYDALDSAREDAVGTRSLRTDGTYLWPDSLSHYVIRHMIALPDDFERHMRDNDWILPAVIEVRKSSPSKE